MAHIGKPEGQIVIQLKHLTICYALKMAQYALGILYRIKSLYLAASGSFSLPVFPFCLHLLDVGTVAKHDLA